LTSNKGAPARRGVGEEHADLAVVDAPRRAALAGQSFADDHEITQARTVATAQLNRRARL